MTAPKRQARDKSARDREAMAQLQRQQRQQQLQARDIAQREETRDAAEELTLKLRELRGIEVQAQVSLAPATVKQRIVEQARAKQREIGREAPREVRNHLPKRN